MLVRGGIDVTLASVDQNDANIVKMSRGIKVQADMAIESCIDRSFDAIIVPGV